jgi:pimeloyl-ACP methyl ester carboxylesterase
MVNFALIHGACHGAWVWDAVIPALSRPAHALDFADGRWGTLHDQARAILNSLRGPTILVGHSAGGFAITAAAQMDPSQIVGLIYLCAYIPQGGKSVAQLRKAGPSQPLDGAFVISADRTSYGFDPAAAQRVFFHDCPEPAAHQLCQDPLALVQSGLPDTLPAVPRAAIICTQDRAIPPEYQAQMAKDIARKIHLPSGHSPFLSMPVLLAQTLDMLADDMGA